MRPSIRFRLNPSLLALFAACLTLTAVPSVDAQSRVVSTPAAILTAPNGRAVGSLREGVQVNVLETRAAFARVSVDGFVERSRLTAQRGSVSPRVGGRAAIIRSRGAATGRPLASLDAGTSLTVSTGSAPAGWVRVSRTGWVLRSSLTVPRPPSRVARETPRRAPTPTKVTAKSSPRVAERASAGEVEPSAPIAGGSSTTAPAPASIATAATAAAAAVSSPAPKSTRNGAPRSTTATTDSALVPTANVALRAAPDARALATVAQGTTLIPLARERGWVRVRLEGWVPERDVAPADTAGRTSMSAADLRAEGQSARGKVVYWSVQVLARQTADGLRRDLGPDETYLLARGPADENALLYLVVPPTLLESTKGIPALSSAMITARVRTGKSDLVGVPILDLLTITVRK